MEERLTALIQWHEGLGDRVASLEDGQLALQISMEANASVSKENHAMLRTLTLCVVGLNEHGIQRPGLVDDMRTLVSGQEKLVESVTSQSYQISSLERSRATLVWAGGILSTIASAIGLWGWSHTDQILTTLSDVYAKPKTEVGSPAPVTGK